jgi:hypothetical protein
VPVIVNKIGTHRNEDAVQRLAYYMSGSQFGITCGGCGILMDSADDVIKSFEFTKQMYEKDDRKRVSHIIIGTKHEGIIIEELTEIAQAAANYFYQKGFQSFYVIHRGSMEDADYLHIHLAVNTVSFLDGKRLYESYGITSDLRKSLSMTFEKYTWSSVNDSSTSWET